MPSSPTAPSREPCPHQHRQAAARRGEREDRAYQIAAANFHPQETSTTQSPAFIAIGKDTASPWSRWGEYLAARAEVRKSASTAKAADYGELAIFDMDGLKAAQARLLKLQQETNDAEVLHAAAAELGFIEVRLEPGDGARPGKHSPCRPATRPRVQAGPEATWIS